MRSWQGKAFQIIWPFVRGIYQSFWDHINHIRITINSRHCNCPGTSSWSPFLWMTRTRISYIINTIAANDLAMEVARSSAAVLLAYDWTSISIQNSLRLTHPEIVISGVYSLHDLPDGNRLEHTGLVVYGFETGLVQVTSDGNRDNNHGLSWWGSTILGNHSQLQRQTNEGTYVYCVNKAEILVDMN